MSNFPTDLDDDTTLPVVNNNITEIGGEAINALRDAVFNIEQNIGLNAQGSALSISDRLGISFLPDGTLKPSVIAGLGFISAATGIYNADVNPNAMIAESKLKLDHRTADLYNYVRDLVNDINIGIGWISTEGIKLEPHLIGAIYRHTLEHIDVVADPTRYLNNKFRTLRNNSDAYQLVNDINNELLAHQWADGSPFGTIQNIVTNNGSTYPSNYAHTASGIFLNTSRFATIPETAQDLQTFAEFIDSSSIFLYGTRIQNLYTNGISKISRSSNLALDGYGPAVVPVTSAIAYLLDGDTTSYPFDDIDAGDDIIEFKPSASDRTSFSFDEKFSLVKPGDIVRINYGTIEVAFVIREKKYQSDVNPLNNRYLVRIAGKNVAYSPTATARIDRSLVNSNKFGVLALGSSQIINGSTNALSAPALPSLIVGSPRGSMALGLGFNPDHLDGTHYNLYLALFSTGFAQDGYTILPAIDVTGNQGATPGKYTLSSVVEATNRAFRQPGYNYRFVAYSYKGEFGIMLADSYNNAAFSIISAAVASDGTYDQAATNLNLPNNVISLQDFIPFDPFGDTFAHDALGFGELGSNIASPPYMATYGSSAAALRPTKIFTALKRNNYYVDGTERDRLNLQTGQVLDTYGDGYWAASVDGYTVIPGSPPSGRVQSVFHIPLDLSATDLKVGKSIVVLSDDFLYSGRFIIEDISFDCDPDSHTYITVYDSIHANGFSPTTPLPVGSSVKVYFNSDSVSFNQESSTDNSAFSPFKRHFEVYTDSEANTYTQERGRYYIGGASINVNGISLVAGSNKFDIVKISPKLRGYQYGTVTKITLYITSFNATTGLYVGYLATTSDYVTYTNLGPTVNGKIGEVVRFYDESNIDYIDIFLDLDSGQTNLTNSVIDIQLFPTLALDDQIMMIGTCQVNDTSRTVSQLRDERQFGNTSEKDFSTSALDFISAPQRLLDTNGVIQGFVSGDQNDFNNGQIHMSGGTALINGKFIQMNPQVVTLPPVMESDSGFFTINWAICVNDKGEYQPIPLLDKFGVVDATSGGPSPAQRIFTAYNVVNGNVYTLDAVTFANLINARKDLTPLYIAKSTVTSGPVFSVAIYDVRKYVYGQSDNIQFTLVPPTGDNPDFVGHFRNVSSMVAWVNMMNVSPVTVKVRGNFGSSSSQMNLTTLRNKLILEGDGAVLNVTTTNGITIKDHVTLKNITFNYNQSSVTPTGNINGYGGCVLIDPTGLTDKSAQDITIEDCIFNSSTDLHSPFICFRIAPDLDTFVTGYIKDVVVRGNHFNDTTDHPAAIAFLNTYQDPSTSGGQAAVLANVLIENNICNQNQIIYVVSTFTITNDGFGNAVEVGGDSPGLLAFNVVIRNNRCGAIAYSTCGSVFFSSSITQKENGLIIEDNRCATIISPVNHQGIVPPNYITSNRLVYNRFCGTGDVTIRDNNCSYISVVNKRVIANSLPANMRITNNRLYANDYVSNVNNIFGFDASADPVIMGTGVTYGIAIYVDHTTANTSESTTNVIIENNTISKNTYNGNSGIDDSGFTKQYYEGGIFSYVPAIIRHNTISGFAGEAVLGATQKTFGIFVTKQAAYTGGTYEYTINHNNIFRGGADLAYFVRADSFGGVGEVVDNFFDSSYCDQAQTNTLVVNHPPAILVDRNKNQIFTKYLRASDFGELAQTLTVGVGGGISFITPSVSLTSLAIQYGFSQVVTATINGSLSVTIGSPTAPVLHSVTMMMPLHQIIPLGTQLFNVSVDYHMTATGAVTKTLDFYILQYGASGPFDNPIFHNTVTDSTTDSGVGTLVPNIPNTINYSTFSDVYFYDPYPRLQLYFTVSGGTGGISTFNISDITIQYVY